MKQATVWHIGGDDVRMRIPLLLALRDRGFSVGALGSETGTGFADHGIAYHRYELHRWLNPVKDWQSVRQLKALMLQHKPDIVHAFDTKPIMLAPAAAQNTGVRACVRTVTGMGYVFSSQSPLALGLRPVYRWSQQRAGRRTAVTIFQNPDDRDYFLANKLVTPGCEALVLGSGIDIGRFLSQQPDAAQIEKLRAELDLQGKTVVTMVARLVRTKGVMEFIAAAKQVHAQLADVAFLLVGPQASEGRQAVASRVLTAAGAYVHWLGERDDVAAILSLSHIFALPSYYREGVPRVLLEAAALGLPLITTAMPGCKEVVRDGWNGLLVPPRDVSALTKSMLELLSDSDKRQQMGYRGKKHVEQFSLSRVADQYCALYHKALGAPGYAMTPDQTISDSPGIAR